MPVPIGRILTDLANDNPAFPAVTCGDDTISRGDLEARSNRLARAYEEIGVRHGDFVTIALPNGIEFIAVTAAVWKLGAVPAPISAKLPERERQAIIDLADPALIVGVPDGVHVGRRSLAPGFEPDPSLSSAPIEPDRVSPYWKAPTSGGSTGRPKLIVAAQPAELDPSALTGMGMRENGIELVPGPLFHNAPFGFAFSGLFLGNHVVVMPRFDAADALRAIAEHRVEWVNLVPTMMLRMLRVIREHPGAYDLSSLTSVWHMAAPCPAWLKEEWIDLIGPEKLWEMYGGTEAQALTIINGKEWLEHKGSVGKPAYGEMKILDTDGHELPPGEVGEIYLRGPDGAGPSYRYVGSEAKTRDGWETLGDMGWLDKDGYLYISDRRTDMILAGGANIYPAEVEAALMEHPLVDAAVVVGLPDEDLGQRVHAVVQATAELGEAELKDFLGTRLVRYKIPRSFRLVAEELRDDAGKVRRSAVRESEIARLAQPS